MPINLAGSLHDTEPDVLDQVRLWFTYTLKYDTGNRYGLITPLVAAIYTRILFYTASFIHWYIVKMK